ncbi:MAG: glycoside hydrolase family 43 protein [Prolixibacteraceae bacterium]
MNRQINLFLLAFFSVFILKAQPVNEFTPGQIWNDNNGKYINAHGGGILFHDNIYYWYGEHKIAGRIGNSAQVGVHCYSSADLYNWKDEGIALKVNETDSTSDIAKGCVLERPKVIYNAKTNKYVMWFHLELKGKGYYAARSGIAVSESPAGPFTYLKSFRPNAGFWPVNVQPCHKKPVSPDVKESYCGGKGCLPAPVDSVNLLGRDFKGGQMARDMNLFVDDDGTAYHIYSSEENSTLHISKLTDDYLSYSGEYFRVFAGRYMEGATLFKRADKYYIIASDCTGWAPNAARSAVADQIFGTWTELGNPAQGNDSETTFHSQSTFVLQVQGKTDSYIYLGDRWTPDNPIDGRYIWLPVVFEEDAPKLYWTDKWSL